MAPARILAASYHTNPESRIGTCRRRSCLIVVKDLQCVKRVMFCCSDSSMLDVARDIY